MGGTVERPEAVHGLVGLLDGAMVLFDLVVEVAEAVGPVLDFTAWRATNCAGTGIVSIGRHSLRLVTDGSQRLL